MITDKDKLTCVKRELRYRRSVYTRWVSSGRMKPDQAERELALMEAIVADYELKVSQTEPALL